MSIRSFSLWGAVYLPDDVLSDNGGGGPGTRISVANGGSERIVFVVETPQPAGLNKPRGVTKGDASQSRIAGGYLRHTTPILVSQSHRHGGEKLIADQAGYRHRCAALPRRLQHEANIFQAEFQGKADWLGLLVSDHAAIVGIHGRGE